MPTEYNSVKISLQKIVQNEEMVGVIEAVVGNVHRILIHTYQLLKLYFLQEEPPPIHETLKVDFILAVMKVIVWKNGGDPPQTNKPELQEWYNR